jgi:uncharacterized protein YoxC
LTLPGIEAIIPVMSDWMQALIALAVVVLAGALVWTLAAARRLLLRAESLLGMLQTELPPLVADSHALLDEMRKLTEQANLEMERVGDLTARVEHATVSLGRIVTTLAGFTRMGQLVGLAVGLRRGVEVFVHRLKG